MSDDSLRVVAPPDDRSPGGSASVWGVVLAAGTSTRFGDRNKLLTDVDGQAMVRRAAETLLEADLAGVAVVLGHDAERVRSALDGLDVTFRDNPAYERGQGTSVVEGVEWAAEQGADAVLIALGDMPFVSSQSVDDVVSTYEAGSYRALAAAYEGRRGNPVLFDAAHFDALTAVEEDCGGRRILLESDDAALVETGDPGVRHDVDRPGDERTDDRP